MMMVTVQVSYVGGLIDGLKNLFAVFGTVHYFGIQHLGAQIMKFANFHDLHVEAPSLV
jgi:hypothetical protein